MHRAATPPQPANSKNVEVLADELMTRIANRLADKADGGVSKLELAEKIRSAIRWEPRPDRNPPAIVIMRCGSKKKGVSNVLAVISSTGEFSDFYPSWVPVLEDWKARRSRSANGVSRVSHEGLGTGSMPVSRKENDE